MPRAMWKGAIQFGLVTIPVKLFSATEEKVVEEHILHARMYFDMPQVLTAAGAKVETTSVDFEPNVVIDRELITGQNPRSDHPIAKALAEALDARQA